MKVNSTKSERTDAERAYRFRGRRHRRVSAEGEEKLSCQRSEIYPSVHYTIGWPISSLKSRELTAKDAESAMEGGEGGREKSQEARKRERRMGREATADFADDADGGGGMTNDE